MQENAERRTQNQENPGKQAAPDVLCLQTMIVNVCLIGMPGARDGQWTLVDTGMRTSEEKIFSAAAERFGSDSKPNAIVLTHGHFDHIGSIQELLQKWNVPVYAHEQELPFLTGQSDYPPADPSVDDGLMAKLSPLYSRKGINLGTRVQALPADGSIPPLPGWRWIHSPGHTPGQISLFRDSDRVLITADAFTTVKQESALAVLTQHQEVHGPPAYFTIDWKAAWESVKKLAALKPSVVISSHGQPMGGDKLREDLEELARNFDRLAIPDHGRYVH
jgi:glyoxylase-like metal-dependent hydrolase (beta-lactamase superfamily II)